MLGLADADLALLTSKQRDAQIHVVFMGQGLLPEALSQRITAGPWDRVIGFKPTGECPAAYLCM